MSKLVKPKKPVANTRQNCQQPEDYFSALRTYEIALAIYETLGGK